MRKKLIIFGAVAAVLAGGFGTYSYLAGVPLWRTRTAQGPVGNYMPPQDTDIVNFQLEYRKNTGKPEYLIQSQRLKPLGLGRYLLDHPRIIWYQNEDNLVVVTADAGTMLADKKAGGAAGKIVPKGGSFSKNVKITYGPRSSFATDEKGEAGWLHGELQSGQYQASFDDDIQINLADRSVESKGAIRIRNENLSFDGANLSLTFNTEERRIEYLRIEHGDKITVKNAEKFGGVLNGSKPATAAAPTAPAPTPAPGTMVAATGKAEPAPTTYKVKFGQDVKGVWGQRKLTTDLLSVIFSVAAKDIQDKSQRNSSSGAKAAPAMEVAHAPAGTDKAVGAKPTGKAEEMELCWVGPLEMRPTAASDLTLANAKDFIVEATGTKGQPVILQEGEDLMVKAGRLWYESGVQRVELEPGEYKKVEANDPAQGKVICQGITIRQDIGKWTLTGPGQLEAIAGVLQDKKPAKGVEVKSDRASSVVQWSKGLELTMAEGSDGMKAGKMNPRVRHIVLTGDADVRDAGFWMHADVIDLLVAHTADGKQGLEQLVAMGGVKVDSVHKGAPVGQAPDHLQTQRLELQTAMVAGQKLPVPSMLVCEGEVVGSMYQPQKDPTKPWTRQQITTPKMVVGLDPRDKAGESEGTLGGFAARDMAAYGGVEVKMEGFGSLPVVATAETLRAEVKTGTAVLSGRPGLGKIPVQFARLQQGTNQIAGMTLQLNQKEQSLEIPGPGDFIFEQATKTGAAGGATESTPVRVEWATRMKYNGKDLKADFIGPVTATMLGKADQESRMTAQQMQVKLVSGESGKPGRTGEGLTMTNGQKIHLESITAQGKVEALGGSFDPQGQVQTRLYVRGSSLVYEDKERVLRIPDAGEMVVEDYRPEEAKGDKTNSRGQTAFAWKDGLTFIGDSGEILMRKDVRMIHVPTKPLKVTGKMGAMASNGEIAAKGVPVTLVCQALTVNMATSKAGTASPVGLGMGGQSRVSKVLAEDAAQLEFGGDRMVGNKLFFDAANNKVEVAGRGSQKAILVRDGVMQANTMDIKYDLKTGEFSSDQPSGMFLEAPEKRK